MNDLVSWDDYSDCSEEEPEKDIKMPEIINGKSTVTNNKFNSSSNVVLNFSKFYSLKVKLIVVLILINPSVRFLLDQIGITLIKV